MTIDWYSSEPAAKQLSAQIISLIRQGALLPGDPLPSMRELAQETGLSKTTVEQAFRLLASTGWIEVRVRRRALVAHRLPGEGGQAEVEAAPALRAHGGASLDSARLAEAAHLLGLDVDLSGYGLTARVRGESSAVRKGLRRRATLRQRRWLGQRLRGVVRSAFACGMTPGELQALLEAASTWETAFTCGRLTNSGGESTGYRPEKDCPDREGAALPPIPPFLVRKVRQRQARRRGSSR